MEILNWNYKKRGNNREEQGAMNRLTKRILTFALAILLAMQPCTSVTAAPQQTAEKTVQTTAGETTTESGKSTQAAEETVQTTQEETVQETEELTQTTEEETVSATEEITTQTSEEETETTQEITTEAMETTEAESLVSALEVNPDMGTEKEITVTTFSELQNVFRSVSDRVVTLGADITVNNPQLVKSGDYGLIMCTKKNNVLDLNGHSISVTKDDRDIPLFVIMYVEVGHLTIRDSSELKTGYCSYKNTKTESGSYVVGMDYGKFTLESGTIKADTKSSAIWNTYGTVEINGGSIVNERGSVCEMRDDFSISGGLLESKTTAAVIEISNTAKRIGSATMSGGIYKTKGKSIISVNNGTIGTMGKHIPEYCLLMLNNIENRALREFSYISGTSETGNTFEIINCMNNPAYLISSVAITVPESVKGTKPENYTVDAGDDCSLKGTDWVRYSKDGNGYLVGKSDILTDLYDYSVEIEIEPKGKFFDSTMNSVRINGTEITDYKLKDGNLYVTYQYLSPYKIQELSLQIAPPAIEEPFRENAAVTGDSSNKAYIEQEDWKTEEAEAEIGEEYTASVIVKTKNENFYFDPSGKLQVKINENISGWKPISYKVSQSGGDTVTVEVTLLPKERQFINGDGCYILNAKGEDAEYVIEGEPLWLVAKAPQSGKRFSKWVVYDDEPKLQPEYSTLTKEVAYQQSTLGIYMGTEQIAVQAEYADTVASSKVIENIGIKGVNMLYGTSYTESGITLESSTYTLESMEIMQEDGTAAMTETDSFKAYKEYTGSFVLKAASGYTFSKTGELINVQGRVNGKRISNTSIKTTGGIQYLYFTCELGYAAYPVTVKNGTVEDEEGNIVTAVSPKQKYYFNATVPAESQFLRWEFTDLEDGEDAVYLDYILNENSSLMEECMCIDEVGDLIGGKLTAHAVYKTGNNSISTIDISGTQTPVIGAHPVMSTAALQCSSGLTVAEVRWLELPPCIVDNSGSVSGLEDEWGSLLENARPMAGTDTFKNAHTYAVVYYATVPTTKVLDNDCAITVNSEACVTECQGNMVMLCKFFKPLFKEGLWAEDIESVTYTGKQIKPELKVFESGNLLTEGKDYTVSYSGNVNAGENKAKARITGKGNYSGSVTKTFTILPASLADSNTDVTADDILVTASTNLRRIYGKPVVKLNGKNVSASEYSVTYENKDVGANFAANGTYTVTITGKGKNFKDSRTINQVVNTRVISRVSVSRISNQAYTGSGICPQPVVKAGREVLEYGKDYMLKWSNNEQIGKATVTITGLDPTAKNEGYSGSKEVSFNIVGTKLNSQNVTMLTKSKEYTGRNLKLTAATDYEVKVGKGDEAKVLVKNVDYSIAYKNNLRAGTATVIFTGMGAYSGTVRKSFRITPASVGEKNNLGIYERNEAIDEIEFPGSAKYQKGGTKLVPGSLKYGEITMVPGKDYTISYRKNIACTGGKATACAIITGRGCFTGKYEHYYSIEEKDLSRLKDEAYIISGTANDKQYRNAANNYRTTFTLTDENGRRLSAGTDYDAKNIKYQVRVGDDYVAVEDSSYFNNNRVSLGANGSLSMRIVIEAAGNYTGTRELYYTLYENSVNQIKVSKIAVQQYTGVAICPQPVLTFGKENTLLGMGTDYSLQYVNNTNRGTATIIIQGRGKYGGTKKVTFRISQTKMAWQAESK